MESNRSVEWELVDYGSAVFHVISYQAGASRLAEPLAVAEEPAPALATPEIPDCFIYRCWVALKDGCCAA